MIDTLISNIRIYVPIYYICVYACTMLYKTLSNQENFENICKHL